MCLMNYFRTVSCLPQHRDSKVGFYFAGLTALRSRNCFLWTGIVCLYMVQVTCEAKRLVVSNPFLLKAPSQPLPNAVIELPSTDWGLLEWQISQLDDSEGSLYCGDQGPRGLLPTWWFQPMQVAMRSHTEAQTTGNKLTVAFRPSSQPQIRSSIHKRAQQLWIGRCGVIEDDELGASKRTERRWPYRTAKQTILSSINLTQFSGRNPSHFRLRPSFHAWTVGNVNLILCPHRWSMEGKVHLFSKFALPCIRGEALYDLGYQNLHFHSMCKGWSTLWLGISKFAFPCVRNEALYDLGPTSFMNMNILSSSFI